VLAHYGQRHHAAATLAAVRHPGDVGMDSAELSLHEKHGEAADSDADEKHGEASDSDADEKHSETSDSDAGGSSESLTTFLCAG
jgi:hypothetical protein